ncbi:MAG: 50S ribosomal protein L9 [Nitrospinae bacterium RIFCSPLOWO2_12_FULL_45_22]|nr:MAG: 50S ribosomal protein L9 [Nitrospinae bacterium RIFCSPLOWO2_12_FULL_45_22]
MKVVLNKDIGDLGKAGSIIEVAEGYARNYLIPRRLALEATTKNLQTFQYQQRMELEKIRKKKGEAEALARKIEEISLTIPAKTGEKDRVFGSITTKDIAMALENEGVEIDKKKILLEDPIKSLGIYTIPIKLHPEVTANLRLWVVKE